MNRIVGAQQVNETVTTHDSGNVPTSVIGATVGALAHAYGLLIPNLPPLLAQSLITIGSGVTLFVLNKLLGKWIDRRWPEMRRRNTNP